MVKSLVHPPFVVQRCLYLDSHLEDMAFVCLANPTAGIFQGDHQRISVTVEPGAKAHITNQSATKIHAMPEGSASQETVLTVGDGGHLEFLPEPLIPFRGSRFRSSTSITVAPTGTLLYAELIAPGRTARGEVLAFDTLESRLTICRPNGPPLYHESYRLEPRAHSLLTVPVFGPFDTPVLGSLLALTGTVDAQAVARELLAAIRSETEQSPKIQVGISRLPQDNGVGVKVLASDTQTVKCALMCLASKARKLLLGYGLPHPRKY